MIKFTCIYTKEYPPKNKKTRYIILYSFIIPLILDCIPVITNGYSKFGDHGCFLKYDKTILSYIYLFMDNGTKIIL